MIINIFKKSKAYFSSEMINNLKKILYTSSSFLLKFLFYHEDIFDLNVIKSNDFSV